MKAPFLWRRLAALMRPEWPSLLLGLGASVVTGVATAGWASLLGPLLSSMMTQHSFTWGPWNFDSATLFIQIPPLILALGLLKALGAWVNANAVARVAQSVLLRLRTSIQSKLLQLPPAWHAERHTGELLSHATSDVAQVELVAGGALIATTRDLLVVASLLVVGIRADWRLFLIFLVAIPGIMLPVASFGRAVRRTARQALVRMGSLTTLAAEQLQALPVVQSLDAGEAVLQRFDEEQREFQEITKKSLAIRGAYSPTVELIAAGGVAAALYFGARAVSREPALAEQLVTFLAATLLLYQPLKNLSNTAAEASRAGAALQRLFELLDTPVPPYPRRSTPPLVRTLAFEEVSLVYPDGRRALDRVSFEVRAGTTVAIVGSSGAGKTSLFTLLLGFAVPTSGRILWDGNSVENYSLPSRRSQLAWMPQEPVPLAGTLRENLLLGQPTASDAALWEALKRAQLTELVQARSLDDQVGERGLRLSGGERQRLALARALLCPASILLLDEPTRSLDVRTERAVQQGLRELPKGRTVLLIAHRLSTVRLAENIVVLSQGRVVEQGTHEVLLAKGGHYATLCAHELAAPSELPGGDDAD